MFTIEKLIQFDQKELKDFKLMYSGLEFWRKVKLLSVNIICMAFLCTAYIRFMYTHKIVYLICVLVFGIITFHFLKKARHWGYWNLDKIALNHNFPKNTKWNYAKVLELKIKILEEYLKANRVYKMEQLVFLLESLKDKLKIPGFNFKLASFASTLSMFLLGVLVDQFFKLNIINVNVFSELTKVSIALLIFLILLYFSIEILLLKELHDSRIKNKQQLISVLENVILNYNEFDGNVGI